MTNTRRSIASTSAGSKESAVKSNASATSKKTVEKAKKGWNSMAHLDLKRFADDDPTLTAGAIRNRTRHPYLAVAELDPSGRAQCKLCGEKITKSSLRMGLWLECHKGYRNLCTLHPNCFWKHPETTKLDHAMEIHLSSDLTREQRATILEAFDQLEKTKRTGSTTAVEDDDA